MVDSKAKVIIFENLKTSNITNKDRLRLAAILSGLNKAILNVGWHFLEAYTRYKAGKVGKAVFKIPVPFTSQECAPCDYTHPDNRKTQDLFLCGSCGHVDNADRNGSFVVKKRAIKLFLDSGTELTGKGIPPLVKGRGAKRKW